MTLTLLFIPIYFFIKKTADKLHVTSLLIIMSVIGGAFISGWLSFSGNSLIDIINSNTIKDPKVFYKWTDALTAPFAEEFFKSIVAFAVLYILNKKDIKSVLISGLGAGFGFQISEDINYVSTHSIEGSSSGVSEALGRIMGGFASHTLYTAVVVIGVFLLFSTLYYKKYRLFAIWCVVSTVLNHFFWNSPFYETSHRINLLSALLFLVQVGTFIEVYLLTFKESNKEHQI